MSRKVLYFDLFGGASGDMLLAAMLDLGLDLGQLNGALDLLGLRLNVRAERVTRAGLSALKASVMVRDEAADHPGGHSHDHHSGHGHIRQDEKQARGGHHHRSLTAIAGLIHGSGLPESVILDAVAVFERLAIAEASVHGSTIESVHFHEVGAADAIGDIVGFCILWEQLGRPELLFGAMPTGGGTVRAAHGELPAPAPATLNLMKGLHVWDPGVRHEMVTPTGAAILVTLGRQVPAWPPLRVNVLGIGAGSRDTSRANILRAVFGTPSTGLRAAGDSDERLALVETNVDDTTGQVVGAACEALLAAGAIDAWWTAVGMKKGRPGVQLSFLSPLADVSRLADVVFGELPTLGLRYHTVDRITLDRTHVWVDTPYGRVRLKTRSLNGVALGSTPEYEDCLAAARRHGVSFREVQEAAAAAARLQAPGSPI